MQTIVENYNPWKDYLLAGVLLLIIGILFAVFQGDGLRWILILGGILMLVLGVAAIYKAHKDGTGSAGTVIGAIMVVLGLVLVIVPGLFSDLLMVLLALTLILSGLFFVFGGSAGYGERGGTRFVPLIIGVVLIVLGIYALLNLDGAADMVMLIIGVVMIVLGLLRIAGALKLRSA